MDAMDCTNFQTSRLFGLWVAPDLNAPTRSVPYLLQGGLGLPDREYYLSKAPKMVETREKYRAHVEAVLGLAKVKDATRRADRILALETKMAQAHATRLESLEVKDANNPWPRTEWPRRAPGLDWNRFFAAAGLDTQPVIFAWHPKATRGCAALVGQGAARELEGLGHVPRRRSARTVPRQGLPGGVIRLLRADAQRRDQQAPRWKRAQGWMNAQWARRWAVSTSSGTSLPRRRPRSRRW